MQQIKNASRGYDVGLRKVGLANMSLVTNTLKLKSEDLPILSSNFQSSKSVTNVFHNAHSTGWMTYSETQGFRNARMKMLLMVLMATLRRDVGRESRAWIDTYGGEGRGRSGGWGGGLEDEAGRPRDAEDVSKVATVHVIKLTFSSSTSISLYLRRFLLWGRVRRWR